MTNEELARLIQDGHTDKLEELWCQIEPYIKGRASKFCNLGRDLLRCERDDLIQSGYIAMVQSLKTFDPEKGAFLPHFTFYLRTAFIHTAKGCTASERYDPIHYADDLFREIGEGSVLHEIIPGEGPDPEETAVDSCHCEELGKKLHEIMDKVLNEREREVLSCRYFSGETFSQIAEREGITHQRAKQIHDDALIKMRRKRKQLVSFVDERTNFFTSSSFERSWESPVEKIARQRATLAGRLTGRNIEVI